MSSSICPAQRSHELACPVATETSSDVFTTPDASHARATCAAQARLLGHSARFRAHGSARPRRSRLDQNFLVVAIPFVQPCSTAAHQGTSLSLASRGTVTWCQGQDLQKTPLARVVLACRRALSRRRVSRARLLDAARTATPRYHSEGYEAGSARVLHGGQFIVKPIRACRLARATCPASACRSEFAGQKAGWYALRSTSPRRGSVSDGLDGSPITLCSRGRGSVR